MKSTGPLSSQSSTPRALRKRTIFLFGAGYGVLFVTLQKLLVEYEGPWFAKLALVAAPWLLLAAGLGYLCRRNRADELEILINRRALAFAFYSALLGLVVVEQLQVARIIPAFVWKNNVLVLILGLLMSVGWIVSGRRYR